MKLPIHFWLVVVGEVGMLEVPRCRWMINLVKGYVASGRQHGLPLFELSPRSATSNGRVARLVRRRLSLAVPGRTALDEVPR